LISLLDHILLQILKLLLREPAFSLTITYGGQIHIFTCRSM